MRADQGPSGHALFVRDWRRVFVEELTPASFADRYRAAGLRWIALYLEHGADANASAELARELARGGLEVWASWGLVRPGTWRARMARFLERARAAHARGILINPENPDRAAHARGAPNWNEAEAAAFLEELERAELPIVVASYGTPQGFPSFPWATWQAGGSTIGMPLLFDRDLSADPARYFARGLEGWRGHGFELLDVAGSTWAHAGRRKKTLAELARHLEELPRTPAVALWSPVPLDPRRVELVAAWTAGDWSRLEELGRLEELPGARGRRPRGGRGGGAVLAVLGVLGLAGAAVASRR